MPETLTGLSVPARYVAASIGAHCAFLPLLTFIVPARISAISDQPVRDLSLLLIAGALTASVANIIAGLASDRLMASEGSRRKMAFAGLGATSIALLAFSRVESFAGLLAAIIGFQLAFNMMFAPLVAVLADHIPNERKGLTAAWVNFALPAGTVATAAAAALAPVLGDWLMAAIAATVALLVLPFLFAWPKPLPAEARQATAQSKPSSSLRRDFLLAWLARLFIQFGAVIVLSYLYLYVGAFGGEAEAARQRLASLGLLASPFALAACLYIARRSDAAGQRRPVLVAVSLAIAAALLLLVFAQAWILAIAGYAIFLAGLTVFLAIDSALVAELLATSEKRGWSLGWMNLTNTLPSIAAPTLTIAVALAAPDPNTIRIALMVAAILAMAGAICVSRIRLVA